MSSLPCSSRKHTSLKNLDGEVFDLDTLEAMINKIDPIKLKELKEIKVSDTKTLFDAIKDALDVMQTRYRSEPMDFDYTKVLQEDFFNSINKLKTCNTYVLKVNLDAHKKFMTNV